MNSNVKDVIVCDFDSIYIVPINEGATRDDVLAAYRKLLKGFGYVWDSHKMLYIATETTEKLRELEPQINYA